MSIDSNYNYIINKASLGIGLIVATLRRLIILLLLLLLGIKGHYTNTNIILSRDLFLSGDHTDETFV